MYKLTFLLLFIVVFTTPSFAQKKQSKEVIITGKILDSETNAPLEYATVVFTSKRDGKIVTGGITNEQGDFNIPVSMGNYTISFEFIGFKTVSISNKEITKDENLGIQLL